MLGILRNLWYQEVRRSDCSSRLTTHGSLTRLIFIVLIPFSFTLFIKYWFIHKLIKQRIWLNSTRGSVFLGVEIAVHHRCTLPEDSQGFQAVGEKNQNLCFPISRTGRGIWRRKGVAVVIGWIGWDWVTSWSIFLFPSRIVERLLGKAFCMFFIFSS